MENHNDFVSIVLVTRRTDNEDRNLMAKTCLRTLTMTADYPYELIMIDNTQNNRGAAKARNLGASMATGKYICFTDDDISFGEGWLSECVRMLQIPGKYISTPIHQPRVRRWEKPMVNGYRSNLRAGSNCMIMKMESWKEIGEFDETLTAFNFGRQYCNTQVQKGYSVLITKEAMADDLGFKKHSYESR